MSNTPNNFDDVIDSRDVIARIEELESELQDAYDAKYGEANDLWHEWLHAEDRGKADEPPKPPDFEEWLSQVVLDRTEELRDAAVELAVLKDLAAQGEDCGDWEYGATLVRESYFKTYAEELADDIGAIPAGATWPNNCIDWERAARELRVDYTDVDFDGVHYLIRS